MQSNCKKWPHNGRRNFKYWFYSGAIMVDNWKTFRCPWSCNGSGNGGLSTFNWTSNGPVIEIVHT